MTIQSLRQRLADGEVILIDGGTGTEVEARGVPMNGSVWCGVAVLEHADVVRDAHEAYIRAGAEVIATCTFPSNRLALEPAGFGDRVAEINRRAVEIALEARDDAGERPVLIAGSLSPHDAEGIPDPTPPWETILSAFREQVAIQAEAGVDLFALEMIPSAIYGRAAAQAAAETGLPVWLGITEWSGDGGWLHKDDTAELVRELVADPVIGPSVMSVNAMHSEVAQIASMLDAIAVHWTGVTGAYAHHGDWVPPNWIFTDITPEDYADAAERWVAQGAQIIGGCCGIGPAHIALLAERLPRRASPPSGG